MYTSVAFALLAASVAASSAQVPGGNATGSDLPWQKDYAQARSIAQTEKKPVAVFFGSGPGGYGKVSEEGQLSGALQKLLADNYTCLYVDVSTPNGKKLAQDFAITRGVGLVLSDRTGELQAFYHDGDLSDADLTRWLKRCADPNISVNATMTNTSSQVSFYPPDANGASGASAAYGYAVGGYAYGYAPYAYQSGGMYYGGGGGCQPGGVCYVGGGYQPGGMYYGGGSCGGGGCGFGGGGCGGGGCGVAFHGGRCGGGFHGGRCGGGGCGGRCR
jgi:hypothetical protein